MHIPDGLLAPPVTAAAGALAAGGFGYALHRLKRTLGERTTVLMGIMSAWVFAAQMVNFPVGPGVSGHLLGGVLAAVTLGPWAGAGVIGAVLLVQCLLFNDGGLLALGANFVNLGLVGAIGGYAIYAPIRRAIGGRTGVLVGAMVAAWCSVLLASVAFSVELALSGRVRDFRRILGWMTLVHAVIGVGEAVITGLVLRFVLLTRPDLIHEPDAAPARRASWGVVAGAGLGLALLVAVLLGPVASSFPDGLEFVGERTGFLGEEAPPVLNAPLPDYNVPGWERWLRLGTAAAGAIGTLVVFAVAAGLARGLGRPSPAVEDVGIAKSPAATPDPVAVDER
jgi:cobalt/nickel transport system permease protein